ELNPVRASMVEHASEYPWSSYQQNAVGKTVKLITPHQEYLNLGGTAGARQELYRSLFEGRMSERDLGEIREATNKAWVLGSHHFREHFETVTGRRAVALGRGGDRKSQKF